MEMLRLFYATKHKAWSHEAEMRLVAQRGDVAFQVPGRITEVILGEKTDGNAGQKVLDVMVRDLPRRHSHDILRRVSHILLTLQAALA
jgi:hypothetical protein